MDVKCIPQKYSKLNLSELQEEKDGCLEKIAFMTKGDANKNDDFQMLYSSFDHSCPTIEKYALVEHLITNASLIRYVDGLICLRPLYGHTCRDALGRRF